MRASSASSMFGTQTIFWLVSSGSKDDAKEIKERIHAFLADTLKLELSDEKTLITHSVKRAHFLGYNIYVKGAPRLQSGIVKDIFAGI